MKDYFDFFDVQKNKRNTPSVPVLLLSVLLQSTSFSQRFIVNSVKRVFLPVTLGYYNFRLCHNKQTKVYLPEPPFPHAEVSEEACPFFKNTGPDQLALA